MCYVIAKDFNKEGCVAYKTTHGAHLAELKQKLLKEIGVKSIQLVTLSRPIAYMEYAPYRFVYTEKDFYDNVIKMSSYT